MAEITGRPKRQRACRLPGNGSAARRLPMAAIGKAFAAQGIFGRKRPFPDAAVFDLPPVDPSAAGQHQPIGKGMAAFDKAADGDVSAARPARPRWKAADEEVERSEEHTSEIQAL